MSDHVLSIVIAFAAYSCVDVGKAVQKSGLVIREHRPGAGLFVWILGTLGTTLSSFLILWAVSIGSVVVVGSMAGTGLVAATLFAVVILHEPLRPRDIVAIVLVLAGPFALGSITTPAMPPEIAVERLGILAGIAAVGYIAAFARFARSDRQLGVVIASLAGMISGYVVMFQKLASSEVARPLTWITARVPNARLDRILGIFANPFAVTWIVLSILSTLVLQLSYRRGNAVQIIPAFNSISILTLILGGVVVFRETLHPLQWLGVATILAGAALLMVRRAPDDNK